MSWPADHGGAGRNWLFLLEVESGTDALLRALSPFPAQGAQVARMALEVNGDTARLEVEAHGLDSDKAAYLRSRLQQVTSVRSVAAGWR